MRQILHRAPFKSPVGNLLAIASAPGLCALEFDLPVRQKLLNARLKRWFPNSEMQLMDDTRKARIKDWLDGYFNGEFPEPPPLDLRGSQFEQSVWKLLLSIPAGETSTYGQLAVSLGIPGSARAVGTAVRRNPMSIIVPCHRVVGADGALRGYGGGLDQKDWLLKHEGVLGR
jgi:O-6-methylguanine DNA methyltransferase